MNGSTQANLSRYKPYPTYRDSDVEWLGEIPAHWWVSLLGYCARIQSGLTLGKRYGDSDLVARPYLRVANVQDGFLDLGDVAEVLLPEEEIDRHELRSGDVLMTEGGDFDKLGRGCVWRSQVAGCLHQNHIFALRPDTRRLLPAFLSALTSSTCGKFYFTSTSQQSTNLATTNRTKIRSFTVPLPSLPEQHSIADFLDRETGRIDGLIAKKRRLIELLEEKRSALISHAVTKGLPAEAAAKAGLNPHVPMKDSGIEWLGEIPAHWGVGCVRRVADFIDGRRIPLSSEERGIRQGEFPYYGASGIIDHVDDYLFDEPLILLGEDGANLLRRSTPLAFVATGKYWVNNHAHILRPRSGSLDYWCYLLESLDYSPWITGAAQPKLTIDRLAAVPIVIPPEPEQFRIVDSLASETACLDALADKNREVIDKLQEYRTALISAAVTGKIDVREEVG